MVFKYVDFGDIKKIDCVGKELVVLDNSVFGGAMHLGDRLNVISLMRGEALTDDLEVIIPHAAFHRRPPRARIVAEKALDDARRVIHRCYTIYDLKISPAKVYETEKAVFPDYVDLLGPHSHWGTRAAVLLALKYHDLFQSRVNLVSAGGSLHEHEFRKALIDTHRSGIKVYTPSTFIDALVDRIDLRPEEIELGDKTVEIDLKESGEMVSIR